MPPRTAAGRSHRAPGPAYRKAGARQRRAALAAVAALGCAGCDPVFDIEGAFFPAWMLCLLAGVAGAAVLRPLFAAAGLEPHLGPLALVYTCLALLISFATWLTFFPV
jgi:hypothetical protein